jgi:hypothetical protein
MAYDKVVDSAKLDAAMTATANAIRAKTGGSSAIQWKETTGFADAVVNVPSSGGGGGVQIQTGEFTITSDRTQYALHGVPFTPKWFAVKGPDFGSAGVPRTVYWQKNSYTGETVTCSHKSTNASLTTVLTETYSAFSSSGFIIKQYLQLPLVAGTYKWVAMTDE